MIISEFVERARALGTTGVAEGFLGRTLIPWVAGQPRRWGPTLQLLARQEALEQRRRRQARRLEVEIPSTLILNVTTACNLRCASCTVYDTLGEGASLGMATMARLIEEARSLGSSRVALAGGEPLLDPAVDQLITDYPDVFFLVFTNGRLMTEARAAAFARANNVAFVVNVTSGPEGRTRRALLPDIIDALELMAGHGLLVGAAATVTAQRADLYGDPRTLDRISSAGARFALFFDYMRDLQVDGCTSTVARRADAFELAPARRAAFVDGIRRWAADRRFYALCVPEDEATVGEGGCGAAGRELVHVSAFGTIDPCPFVPYSALHVSEYGLLDALRSPYFRTLRARSRSWEQRTGSCAFRAAETELVQIHEARGVRRSAAAAPVDPAAEVRVVPR